MSNYPPGVTGRERAIAGPSWEGEIERSCDQVDVEIAILGVEAQRMLVGVQRNPRATTAAELAAAAVTLTAERCPFIDGEVYAWASSGALHWGCPVCGHEYEEDERDEHGPDPDAAWDSRFDDVEG